MFSIKIQEIKEILKTTLTVFEAISKENFYGPEQAMSFSQENVIVT